eukprot:CAMPEP_0198439638 /NCGR_PEP_ID=MMETSP1452-20131203/55682_1 /TAXON_ID=1181717 /ORGANISM="Synchroma pusillum, Strain CCMP3072" /LENGTH=240 /DNA_ID=CAMNT_0044160249 /DNA_START=41 /DNA_END=763 /DNA_ORIENTATION=-
MADGPVPESFTKKMQREAELETRFAAEAKAEEERLQKKSAEIYARAQQYEEEYAQTERALIDNRRQAKADGNIFVPPEPKVAFVIRIRGLIGNPPKIRKILQLLRLRQINNGVFVRLTASTIKMLRLVEPYVTYGYPSLAVTRALVYKRGFGKVSKMRLPLSDNSVIEHALGKHGITCMEDVVHELHTCGPNFSQVSNFLWPFKLTNPSGGFGKKLIHFIEGGQAGNRGESMTALIKRML